MRDSKKGVERGQSITFRIPSDTPDHLVKQLQQLKETEKRNFSSKIAQFVLRGVSETISKERETVTVPLPRQLTKEQRNWIKHEHSEALIGSIVYQLLKDPVRATTLLASLNSNAYDIEEALYLQEENMPVPNPEKPVLEEEATDKPEEMPVKELDNSDLDDLSMDSLMDEVHSNTEEEEETEEENPLDDFLSSMNN